MQKEDALLQMVGIHMQKGLTTSQEEHLHTQKAQLTKCMAAMGMLKAETTM